MSELFDAVDALLAAAEPLPEAAERRRLREAGHLSLEQIGKALGVTARTVAGWEAGKDPAGEKRAAYARLLEGLAARYPAPAPPATAPPASAPPAPAPPALAPPAPAAPDAAVPAPAPESAAPRAPEPAPTPANATTSTGAAASTGASTSTGAGTRTGASPARSTAGSPRAAKKPAAKKTAAGRAAPAAAESAPDPRFACGPLVVLDGDGTAYGVGGLVLDCPATTLPALVQWALETPLGAARLHRHGRDSDPLVVLTAAAAERFGLPPRLEDRRGLRLPADHPILKQLARAGWQLTRRGFGPWPRIYRPLEDAGQRQCVQLAVLPWDALDARSWPGVAGLPPADLAAVLGDYAARVLTPRGTPATCGLELMSALRPPTRPVKDEESGRWVAGPVPGSFTRPIEPAWPEPPDDHPVAQGRPAGQAVDEEAYDWIRPIEAWTDEECALPFVVGLDANMAFAAAANRLLVGTGEPVHATNPRFDAKLPGTWYADLSHVRVDPRLPSPFTPTGQTPTGPAWYATPTLAYAVQLGYDVHPTEAFVRPEHGPYFDPWYDRLRAAYLATMAEVGVTPGMPEEDFLAAMAVHKGLDAGRTALLAAIKATVKGGVGKLAERAKHAGYRPGERWAALERPTWSPHARQQLIATNRIGQARKMAAWARHGLFPIAVLSDCVVYPARTGSPIDLVPRTPEGTPVPGGFRLGVSPGMVKLEGVRPLTWAAELVEDGHNPGRHIKGDAAVSYEE